MNRLIAKLDLKDYCNNRTTLKIHLLEDGQLTYRLAATKSGMGHAMSNLQIGFKNDSRLPDHIQDIEGFLEDHILNCIEDSVKTYIPDSYITYFRLEQENDIKAVSQQNPRDSEIKNYIKSLPDQYDMSGSQYDLWEDMMNELNISETKKEDDWDFEESIVNILGELEEYQSVNPQETLQIAIDNLRKSIK